MALLPTRKNRDEEREGLFPELGDSLFRDFWRGLDLLPWQEGHLTPSIDVAETDNAIVVTAELPGVKPDQVEVTVEGDMLSIKGQKKEEKEEKRKGLYRVERRYGSFARTIHLPSSVDPEKVKAHSRDGILTIEIPKREDSKPKKIQINVK